MVHVSMNSVPWYAKSNTTLRIDKIWYVFCKSTLQKSYVTLHYMVHISINSIPRYAKSDTTLHMLHMMP